MDIRLTQRVLSFSVPNFKQNQAGRRGGGRGRQATFSNRPLQTVYEIQSIAVSTNMSAGVSDTTTISPGGLLLAGRLTGYQAIADEVRIDRVDVEYQPVLGRGAIGRVGAYIERDPTAAAVATVELASDQREAVSGNVSMPYVLHWRPQEPADREFHLLNPGSTSLGKVIMLGASIRDSGNDLNNTVVFIKRVHVWMTIRGRP